LKVGLVFGGGSEKATPIWVWRALERVGLPVIFWLARASARQWPPSWRWATRRTTARRCWTRVAPTHSYWTVDGFGAVEQRLARLTPGGWTGQAHRRPADTTRDYGGGHHQRPRDRFSTRTPVARGAGSMACRVCIPRVHRSYTLVDAECSIQYQQCSADMGATRSSRCDSSLARAGGDYPSHRKRWRVPTMYHTSTLNRNDAEQDFC